MRGNPGETDERGVSEIYGSLLIISLAFILAILLVAVGTFVVSEMQSESQDSLTQDSMAVMNERIADVTASDANATSAFMFPESDGEIETSPDDTVVTVTVRARLDAGYIEADERVNQTELSIGTIAYEGSTGVRTAWQGGGLWERQQGVTSILEPPQLNYDGTSLNLGFTNLTDATRIRAGQEYTIRGDAQSAAETSEEMRALFEALWTVAPDGDVLGTHTVDVVVEIESEFADGWATWATEGMQQPLDDDDVRVDGDVVTMQFTEVGTPFNDELFSDPVEDWPDHENVLYAGHSSYAVFNEAIEPLEGSGFVINHSYAVHNDSIDAPDNRDWYVALYDKYEREFVITDDGERWWVRHGLEDFGTHEQTDAERAVRLTDQLGGTDAITPSDGDELDDGEEGEYVYDFEYHQVICVFGDEAQPHTSTYDEIRAICDSLIGMSNDPRTIVDGPEFVVEEMQPADGSDWNAVELEAGEPLSVEAIINNTGDVPGDGSVFLKVDDGLTTGITIDGLTVTGMIVDEAKVTELGLAEEKEVTLEWVPSDGDIGHIYRGLDGGSTAAKVVTGSDYETSGNVIDYEHDPPESPRFVMDEEEEPWEYSIEVLDFESGEWDDYQEGTGVDPDRDRIRVNARIWNEGAAGSQTITLWYEGEDGYWTPVNSTREHIEAYQPPYDQNTRVTIEWSMDSLHDDVDTIDLHVTTADDELHMGTIDIE